MPAVAGEESGAVHIGLLDDLARTGVRPDSVQVLDGTLASGLPTLARVWLYFGLRTVEHRW